MLEKLKQYLNGVISLEQLREFHLDQSTDDWLVCQLWGCFAEFTDGLFDQSVLNVRIGNLIGYHPSTSTANNCAWELCI